MIPAALSPASILRLRIRLRFTATARFHFLHGGVIHGLLARALGEHLPETVIPFCPESGRVVFEADDGYHLGLTLVGEARSLLPRLTAGLAEVGGARAAASGAPVTLGGNFVLESVDELSEISEGEIEAAAMAASRRESITVRFLSPLRLKLPNDGGVVGTDGFPAELFLERLGQRLGFLATGRFPYREELPAIPTGVSATPRSLLWIDLPLKGRPEARSGRPDRMTLGGVLGTVELAGLSPEWHRLLALGRFLHAGASTGYGLGRYSIEETLPASAELFLPARSLLERAAEPAALEAALEHLRSRSDAAGGDGVTPEELADAGDPALEALSAELLAGTYQPPPLQGFVLERPDGKLRPLAVPTVRDRVAQRAAGQTLAAGIDTLLEDCSYAYRKGFSRSGAARAIQKAYEDGYRTVLDADIAAFFDSVDLDRLLGKLRALYPFEPIVELIDAWLHVPVLFDGKRLERDRGVPQGSPISPLLANLYLDEFDEEILGQGYRLVRSGERFVVLCRDAEAAREAWRASRWMAGLGVLNLQELRRSSG
ncbi:MAG: reverse transcriptase domain-containing protein [Thermoanaerobaculia bacterium]|nr:reverse transcriptase domain-containing protein [Thermoanaerobaculia bacterium]